MKIKPGIYQHYKGPLYQVYDVCQHSETEEALVVYRCLYGNYDLWARPYRMFIEEVEFQGKKQPRFKWLREASAQEFTTRENQGQID